VLFNFLSARGIENECATQAAILGCEWENGLDVFFSHDGNLADENPFGRVDQIDGGYERGTGLLLALGVNPHRDVVFVFVVGKGNADTGNQE
jgi:hypothetical protein